MEALMSSLYVVFGKDELLFQSLFGLPQLLVITQGVEGADDFHSVAQKAFIEFGFS
jgi:hypothetical protein